jgi:hypothetical protein
MHSNADPCTGSAIVKQCESNREMHAFDKITRPGRNYFANFPPTGVLSAEALPFPPREGQNARK